VPVGGRPLLLHTTTVVVVVVVVVVLLPYDVRVQTLGLLTLHDGGNLCV